MTKLYNVVWEVNKVVKETIAYQVPERVAKSIKRKKETSTHKMGKVKLV